MYTISIDVFEGPFDLLLQLIEREKLDISAISLSQVADQFLAHVTQMEETVKAGELADFLVIAARLVLIKSRLLLPRASRPDDEELEEDPAEVLARQLREYKRFKEAAGALRDIEDRGLHAYPRNAPLPPLARDLPKTGRGRPLAPTGTRPAGPPRWPAASSRGRDGSRPRRRGSRLAGSRRDVLG